MKDKTVSHPNLETFFSPNSVAVIGASPEKSTIRGRLLDNLISNGFQGKIYPVNPSHQDVQYLVPHYPLTPRQHARVLSCGVACGARLQPQTDPSHVLHDDAFRTALQLRMGMDLLP